jgi:hypothetical protein
VECLREVVPEAEGCSGWVPTGHRPPEEEFGHPRLDATTESPLIHRAFAMGPCAIPQGSRGLPTGGVLRSWDVATLYEDGYRSPANEL